MNYEWIFNEFLVDFYSSSNLHLCRLSIVWAYAVWTTCGAMGDSGHPVVVRERAQRQLLVDHRSDGSPVLSKGRVWESWPMVAKMCPIDGKAGWILTSLWYCSTTLWVNCWSDGAIILWRLEGSTNPRIPMWKGWKSCLKVGHIGPRWEGLTTLWAGSPILWKGWRNDWTIVRKFNKLTQGGTSSASFWGADTRAHNLVCGYIAN